MTSTIQLFRLVLFDFAGPARVLRPPGPSFWPCIDGTPTRSRSQQRPPARNVVGASRQPTHPPSRQMLTEVHGSMDQAMAHREAWIRENTPSASASSSTPPPPPQPQPVSPVSPVTPTNLPGWNFGYRRPNPPTNVANGDDSHFSELDDDDYLSVDSQPVAPGLQPSQPADLDDDRRADLELIRSQCEFHA